MKKYFKLFLVLILLLAFILPASAIKIAPYSQPLHDIMHWDVTSAKLIIQNPENETQTVSWPSTVDLWNYNGNVWTYDLPTGDKFAFSKRVDVNISTTEGAGSTVRGISLTDTVGAAGAIHEGVYSLITSAFATGTWTNAVTGVITYSATGSASGGLAAALCGEINMQAAASSGGSYYNVHSYFSVPTAAELIDSTAFNYAFERYESADNASHDFDLYGLLWHIVGLSDATTKILYNNTLKIQIDTTKWYIPLSSAEGQYRSDYPVGITTTIAGAGGASVWGQSTVSGEITETSYIRGLLGIAVNSGTLNHANIHMAGLHGQLGGSGDYTAVSEVFAIWADSGIPCEAGAPRIVGESALLGMTNNGSEQLDSCIYVRGNYCEGDQGAFENMFTFDLCNWAASDSPIQNGGTGDKTLKTGGEWKKIRIDIDGTQFYLIAAIDPDES